MSKVILGVLLLLTVNPKWTPWTVDVSEKEVRIVFPPPEPPAYWQLSLMCNEAAICFSSGNTYATNGGWLICGITFDADAKVAYGNGANCAEAEARVRDAARKENSLGSNQH